MHIHITIILLLIIYTIQDIRHKKINIIYGIIAAALILIYTCTSNINNLPISIGGAAVGIILYMFSIITKEQIGKGDAVLLMITGIGLGFWDNISFFFMSLMFAAFYSILKIIKNGFHKRQYIPFIPFMLSGYMLYIIIQYK